MSRHVTPRHVPLRSVIIIKYVQCLLIFLEEELSAGMTVNNQQVSIVFLLRIIYFCKILYKT